MNTDKALEMIRHASCCGKIKHHCIDSAEAAVVSVINRHGFDGKQLTPYYCIFCNCHHIGRKAKGNVLATLSDIERLLRFDFLSPCTLCPTVPVARKSNERLVMGRAETEGRYARARVLLSVLDGIVPPRASEEWWKSLATKAKVKSPSEKTRAIVRILNSRG